MSFFLRLAGVVALAVGGYTAYNVLAYEAYELALGFAALGFVGTALLWGLAALLDRFDTVIITLREPELAPRRGRDRAAE